jgi:F-type H+-transporting ATPase subunit gamma
MPQSTKEITRRIKSVSNTKKVTKAMELVAAAKMKKTVETTLASRFYAHYSWDILTHLASLETKSKPALLRVRPVKKIAIILITSDKGLCGSYNTAIIKKVLDQLNNPQSLMINRVGNKKIEPAFLAENLEVEFICLGRKGAEIARKLNKKVAEVFTGINDHPHLKDLKPVSSLIISEYKKKNYDKVVVAYTDYKSTLKQIPKLRQLLPISEHDLEKIIHGLDTVYDKYGNKNQAANGWANGIDYKFEPNKRKLMDALLAKLVEQQLYQLFLESIASEHSARMLAMKNASESADEMIGELNLIYNKARQAAITQEIAEISAGRAALAD